MLRLDICQDQRLYLVPPSVEPVRKGQTDANQLLHMIIILARILYKPMPHSNKMVAWAGLVGVWYAVCSVHVKRLLL